jgi:hypothetical protein
MSTTETTQAHEHAFPANPPDGTYLRPGPCKCGKTYDQARADEALKRTLTLIAAAYGVPPRVGIHWAVAYGSEGLNDGVGSVLEYDDLESAREHVRWTDGGVVAKRTVIALRWEAVPGEEPVQ